MERSMSSYTEYTEFSEYTNPSEQASYPSSQQPHQSSGTAQSFLPTPSLVDVNGELGDFAGLDLMGMDGAAIGYDGQWNAGAPQGDYQQTPPQHVHTGQAGYTDSFDRSFPPDFPPLFRQEYSWRDQTQQFPADSSAIEHKVEYPVPTAGDWSYYQPRANNVGTDEGSTSQPGTGLISPQAIFPPAFVNPADYHAGPAYHYPAAQTYYNPQFHTLPQQPAPFTQLPLAPNMVPGQMPTYNHLTTQQSSMPLSRANSMSSQDKIRTKTCLTKDDRLKIYEMSKQPNMRQQDVALKFNIDRSTVSKIVTDCKKTEQRRRNGEEEKPVPKQSKSGVARYPEVDTAVGLYVDTRVAQGLTTNPEELHALALEVAAKSGYKDFKGSAKWVDNFYKRRAIEGKAEVGSAKSTTPPTPQYSTPVPVYPLILEQTAPTSKPLPISKSFSTTSLSEMAGPSHARQRSQSSPQKAGLLPTHQQPLPISQSSLAPRPSLTRSHSMGMSSKAGRGHRSRASIASPSLARSAFQLDKSLAPVQEDGAVPSRIRHTHSRSDALGLGSWASMPPSMMTATPYHQFPHYAPAPFPAYGDFQPPQDAGPSDSKRARR